MFCWTRATRFVWQKRERAVKCVRKLVSLLCWWSTHSKRCSFCPTKISLFYDLEALHFRVGACVAANSKDFVVKMRTLIKISRSNETMKRNDGEVRLCLIKISENLIKQRELNPCVSRIKAFFLSNTETLSHLKCKDRHLLPNQ